jgi:anthranilate/para-aminobenzoate synthase component II
MVELYGGSIKDSEEYVQTHKKLTHYNENHFLFRGYDITNIEWSFSHQDVIEKMPSGFTSIAMCDTNIVGISDEDKKRYGVLFHPEDIEVSWSLLDNFINRCGGSMNDQENILQGKFEHLKTFKDFKN